MRFGPGILFRAITKVKGNLTQAKDRTWDWKSSVGKSHNISIYSIANLTFYIPLMRLSPRRDFWTLQQQRSSEVLLKWAGSNAYSMQHETDARSPTPCIMRLMQGLLLHASGDWCRVSNSIHHETDAGSPTPWITRHAWSPTPCITRLKQVSNSKNNETDAGSPTLHHVTDGASPCSMHHETDAMFPAPRITRLMQGFLFMASRDWCRVFKMISGETKSCNNFGPLF